MNLFKKTLKFFAISGIFTFPLAAQNENDLIDFNTSFNIYTNNLYSSNQDVLITVSAYNITKRPEFNFEIYKIRDVETFFAKQTSTYTIDVLGKDSTNLLTLCDEVDSFNKTFKTEGSGNYHYLYETITYKPKQKGAFLVRVSYKNKVAYSGFFVTDIGIISEAANNGLLAYTVDRNTGEPISDIDLSFYFGQRKLGVGRTLLGLFFKEINQDDRTYAASQQISYPMIIGKKGDDIAVSDPYLYFGYGGNMYYVYIVTNQPVYRPKSVVQFKGTIRKANGSEFQNFPSREITVKIKDSRHTEAYKTVLNTNSNGSFSGEYTVPDNAPLGTYYIYAQIDEGQEYTGSFSVEEYKKPEYKVEVTLDKDQYSDGDVIRGVVQADYYFGSPVQDAVVEYNVYKKQYYKPWWYFSEYRWWYEDYYASQDENAKYNNAQFIFSGKGKLDKEGRFDFTYEVKENFKAKNLYWYWYDEEKQSYETDFIYIIQAKVTDKSRREIGSTRTAYVTRAGFFLAANTSKYLYQPGEEVSLEVRAADFGDKPVETNFEATINKITWGRHPDYKQEKTYVTTVSGRTKADGLGIVTFDAKDEGYYEIQVSSMDNRGKKVTAQTYAYVSSGDMWWWWNQSGTVQIIPDKESYKPGEICKALIITTSPGANVLITTQNDNILSYRVEKIEGTSRLLEFPIESHSAPNFHINVAYVSGGQFYTGNKSVMVVPETKFLNLTIGTDKPTYKPKEEGTFVLKVTDNYGNPVSNAEIAVGVVDESIYAIKPDNTKDVRKFFYSPRFSSVSAHYNSSFYYYGYSRLITIYERFNIRNMSESELGTVKGRLTNKEGNGISGASIIIDGDFAAGVTGEDGSFEFKMPPGSYSVGVVVGKKTRESQKEISISRGQTITVNLRADGQDIIITGEVMDNTGLMRQEAVMDGAVTRAPKISESEVSEDRVMSKKEKGKDDESISFVEADLRSDFRDAIYWSPTVETDASGYATVKVQFPDNLTTWRITARAITADTRVGQQINSVLTRKDLLVRMETPRFFQQNDEVTIATIIHNYLSEDKQTRVELKAENLELVGQTFLSVNVGKNEEKRIDWKVKVTQPIGFAKLTASALTNQESDAVEVKVPLQPHGLQLAEYKSMDISDLNKTEVKFLSVPEYTDLRSTKLTLNVSPSLASVMLTALDGLVGYPYGCVEQTMSRFLPTVIVANAFHDLNAPISAATKKELPKMVEAGYNRLYSMQHYDGGWGWWTNDQTHPFMTSYVIYGLALGRAAGFEVKPDVLANGIKSLKEQLKNKELDATTRAYMLYSLSYAQNSDTKLFEEQLRILSDAKLNDYAISLLSMAANNFGFKEEALKYNALLLKGVQEGEAGAFWGGQAWHYNWQDDKVQTTAMAVKALVANMSSLKDNPELLNKAIRWLMMQRHGAGWNSTQETAFIVYAIVDYLKNSKELEPDYDVKIYVNNDMIMSKHMTKADIFEKEGSFEIEGAKLKSGANEIRIEKNGPGKVYVASNLTYYTNESVIQPRENGFRVEKEFFKLEKYQHYGEDKITYRKRYLDGSVKSGDEILVKVRVAAKEKDQPLQYFMLEDPIPAGCEVIKDDWAYTIDDEKDYSGWDYYWWRWWYADKDIRDNRVTFFATYLYGDTYEFSYILRAQIPGKYSVIPATGMLMYYPEVRGSSEELKLEIL